MLTGDGGHRKLHQSFACIAAEMDLDFCIGQATGNEEVAAVDVVHHIQADRLRQGLYVIHECVRELSFVVLVESRLQRDPFDSRCGQLCELQQLCDCVVSLKQRIAELGSEATLDYFAKTNVSSDSVYKQKSVHTSVECALKNTRFDHEIDALLAIESQPHVVELSENEFRVKLLLEVEIPLTFNSMSVTFDCINISGIVNRAHQTHAEDTPHAQLVFLNPTFDELSHPHNLLRPDVSAALWFLILRVHPAPIIDNPRIRDGEQLLQNGILRRACRQGTRLTIRRVAQLLNQHTRRVCDRQILVRLCRVLRTLPELEVLGFDDAALSLIRIALLHAACIGCARSDFRFGLLLRSACVRGARLLLNGSDLSFLWWWLVLLVHRLILIRNAIGLLSLFGVGGGLVGVCVVGVFGEDC